MIRALGDLAEQVELRLEGEADADQIRRVHELAFEQPAEADLVDALRAADAVILSMVAVVDGVVIGHILYSPVAIDAPGNVYDACGLGPMGVVPPWQRRGVGTRLVRTSLDLLRAKGHEAVVVVGHPTYYPRFGFVPASRFGLTWEHTVADEAFMALALQPRALAGKNGTVRYRPELGSV